MQADRTKEREIVKMWTQGNYIKDLCKGLKEN